MESVLVVTEPDDIHAVLVKLALERKKANCELFFSADMPGKQKNNIVVSEQEYSWSSIDATSENRHRYDNTFDSIWWRRPRTPYIPSTVHENDLAFVRKENGMYHDSIPYLFHDKAWYINPIASHQKTRSKIVQLKIARQCGFKLPETLISNSPEDIKTFIKLSNGRQVIYKSFFPQYWAEEEEVKVLYTNKIAIDDLPSDSMLQVVPGIYQYYIEKKYELRVTCFGSYISAVKIDSQKHDLGLVDWRKIPSQELSLSEVILPDLIKNKIMLFMIKMGIVFGCFDFIVTPEDHIVFLELNEQGQFLWIENLKPELCYLDIFSEFIIGKNFNFSWKKSAKTIRSADLDAKAQKIVNTNMERHVYLNQIRKVA